ncbi:hypothetical protein D2E65_16105 [Mycobacteroides abscessus]|uniref:hypothetical protein n=1 Tax=Mycobacteroides abscessus TaxID=36809 RepID=UPI000E67F6EF|nr:hypothetical protein [Mycobacteroides abscessus]RIR77100.1 hypothetical protein D2E65_16105 [Mycobacteroides abscessus]
MAPSGEHRPEDLGYKAVYDASIATGNSAIALRQRVAQLHTEGAGKTVAAECEALTTQAGITEKLAAAFATTAASLKIREDAARAWNRDAPKDSQIKTAEEAVTAAKNKLKDAAVASGDTSAASKELEDAQKHLGDLHRRRRDADRAYDAAEKRADAKLKELDGEYAPHSGGRGHSADGTPAPGTGNGNGGTPAPSTGAGRPSGQNGVRTDPSKTPGGTPKPSSIPSATPGATKPSSTETSSGDDLSGLLTQLAAQQQQPQPQQALPTAQATPTATTPQVPQSSQPTQDKVKSAGTNPLDKILGSDGVFGLDDAARALGAPAVALGGGSAPTTSAPSTPAAAVTSSSPAASAPSTTGLSASATSNQQPVTSGTSAANLHTSTDVTGRPGEQQRGAFSPGPETKTSGATSTGTSGATPASATGTRPMGAGGMPMVPMGAMGGPGSGAGKDREQAQTTLASGSEESYYLHGRQAVDAAVPGGTIAQKDHPRRRPESDAA